MRSRIPLFLVLATIIASPETLGDDLEKDRNVGSAIAGQAESCPLVGTSVGMHASASASYIQMALQPELDQSDAPCDCDHIPLASEALGRGDDRSQLLQTKRIHQSNSVELESSCESFCKDHECPCLKPWAERCLVRSCAACPECSSQPAAASVPAQTLPCTLSNVDLDFQQANLTLNNLGNLGPDDSRSSNSSDSVLRFEKVLLLPSGKQVDLIISNTSEYQRSSDNVPGKFMEKSISINVQGNSSVNLNFAFVESGSNKSVIFDEFHFTILDIDSSYYAQVLERVLVPDLTSYVVAPGTDVKVSVDSSDSDRLIFESKAFGLACDNPNDPMNLTNITCRDGASGFYVTTNQERRSALLIFRDVSDFQLRLEAPCSEAAGPMSSCQAGRDFLFSWDSSLSSACA